MRTAFVFPGQGSQHPGMVREVMLRGPAAAEVFEMAHEICGTDLAELCESGDPRLLARTDYCQISVAATSLAWLELLRREGIEPQAVAGHSLGECCAACAAGCMSVEDCLRLVWKRGRAMLRCSLEAPGGMLALLGAESDKAQSLLDSIDDEKKVTVANLNSASQVVLAGDTARLRDMAEKLRKHGLRCVPLKVSGAFHTSAMRPAQEEISEHLAAMSLREPTLTLYSAFTGSPVSGTDEVADCLARGITSPVLWRDVQRGLAESGMERQIEVGPGDTLTRIGQRDYPQVLFMRASEALGG